MADLSQMQAQTVRRLLVEAPDAALKSLGAALAAEQTGAAAERIREMVDEEANDRSVRDAVFAPLRPLFAPAEEMVRLSFPSSIPAMLWRALREEALGEVQDALIAGEDGPPSVKDGLCRTAARGLAGREGAFAPVAERLDAQAGATFRLVLLLDLAPILRDSVGKLDGWLLNLAGEHDAAIRLAFRDAAEFGDEAGFLFMEGLLAHLEHPCQILRLVAVVMDHPTERYLAASELASFGERLLDLIDRRIETVRRFDPRRGLEAGVAAAAAAALASAEIGEFERGVALSREGAWGARLTGQRRALALAMETRLREAESAVAAALPTTIIRNGMKRQRGGPLVVAEPSPPAMDRALALLALLDGCRVSASHAGYGMLRGKVAEAVSAWLDGYVTDLLEMLHAGRVDARLARSYLDLAADFVGLAQDPTFAALVRRRAAAA